MSSDAANALLVPYRDAQRALEAASAAGILDSSLKIQRTDKGLLLPVARVPQTLEDGRGAIEFFAATGSFEAKEPRSSYRDHLLLSEKDRAKFPGAFDVIGDVALVRFPEDLRAQWPEAAAALMRQHRSVKVVCHDRGVEGDLRVRSVEVVAGEPRTVAEHREHGLRLRVDVATAYFSPRLATERKRIAGWVKPGERVLDMFAGVGPFSLLIARESKPSRVVAIDANPEAYRYLVENIRLNKAEDVVEPALGLAQDLAPSFAPVDRVIMNLPHLAPSFLPVAVRVLARSGVIHVYEVVPEDQIVQRAELRRFEAAAYPGVASCELLGAHEVRTYAPRQVVVAIDLRIARSE